VIKGIIPLSTKEVNMHFHELFSHGNPLQIREKPGACISRPGFTLLDYDGRIPMHAAKNHAVARSARSALPGCTQRL
jgi:hypothetical protein